MHLSLEVSVWLKGSATVQLTVPPDKVGQDDNICRAMVRAVANYTQMMRLLVSKDFTEAYFAEPLQRFFVDLAGEDRDHVQRYENSNDEFRYVLRNECPATIEHQHRCIEEMLAEIPDTPPMTLMAFRDAKGNICYKSVEES